MVKVSVLMPAYNAEKYIGEAIESILNQTFKDFEFIIVDDCSVDSTWSIVKKYASTDQRIRAYKNEKNLGVVGTRNKLISLSLSSYVAWQDADDVSLPRRIEKELSFLEENEGFGVVGGFLEIFNGAGFIGIRDYPESDDKIRKMFFKCSPVSQPVAMIKKECFEKVGNFNPKYSSGAEDLDIFFRIGQFYKIANIQEVLLKYREDYNSTTFRNLKRLELNTLKIRFEYFKGYGPSFSDLLYNFFHLLSLCLPISSKKKLKLFSYFRNKNPLSFEKYYSHEKMLDIGCGRNKTVGATGLDIVNLPGVDVVHDLNIYPYPFPDNHFDAIHANMVLEHLDDFVGAMKEMHRLLDSHGILYVKVPYFSSLSAFIDPTHKNFFTEKTFLYFTDGHNLSYYTDIRFEIMFLELRNNSSSFLEKCRNIIPFKKYLKFFFLNMYDSIFVVLRKK